MRIIKAWQSISPGVIVKGVEKCCISNRMDGTDDNDDMLWDGSEEDGNVKSFCEDDEGTDCDGGVTLIGKHRYNLTHLVY
jgi:hypothetical protein